MAKYKLVNTNGGSTVSCIKDTESEPTKFIPLDTSNTDYKEYLAWVAEGNTADAAD